MSIVEVLSLGFAAAAFALYVWSPFGSKGAEQLVVRPLLRHTRFWMIASDEMALHGQAAMQDFESLAKTLAQSVAQRIGPKLAKGQAPKKSHVDHCLSRAASDARSRLYQFPDKANINHVMKAVEAEEAMILLDLDKALSANFPPVFPARA
ncbi:unnamed protein product [Symbiodinium natans]|uniref:Uncharacterized protein n=1 Tax=Symbiodinium natans TaxID=878477 RepID=A0A812L0D1_9DINO|nr:unnamed protein product [Symbiodinium natans]